MRNGIMGKLTKPSVIKSYMNKYRFHFKKDLGQNFLIDDDAAEKIVDALALTGEETVLEIGPGIGALTELLVQKARRVIAVEIDPFAIKMLKDIFADTDNLEIVHADVLKTDLHALIAPYVNAGEKITAVSNLPYYITSPVIMKLLEDKLPLEAVVVMLQKEVAARLGIKPGSKDYSAFTVVLEYYAETNKLFDVSRNSFMPAPNVDSSVVCILPRKEAPVEVRSETHLFQTIHAAFATRRKTILNCISAGFQMDKESTRELLALAGIPENNRAETITLQQYAVLSDLIMDRK